MSSPFLGETWLTSWPPLRAVRGTTSADSVGLDRGSTRKKKNPPWALLGRGAVQPLVLKLEGQIRRGGVLGIFGSQFWLPRYGPLGQTICLPGGKGTTRACLQQMRLFVYSRLGSLARNPPRFSFPLPGLVEFAAIAEGRKSRRHWDDYPVASGAFHASPSALGSPGVSMRSPGLLALRSWGGSWPARQGGEG